MFPITPSILWWLATLFVWIGNAFTTSARLKVLIWYTAWFRRLRRMILGFWLHFLGFFRWILRSSAGSRLQTWKALAHANSVSNRLPAPKWSVADWVNYRRIDIVLNVIFGSGFTGKKTKIWWGNLMGNKFTGWQSLSPRQISTINH